MDHKKVPRMPPFMEGLRNRQTDREVKKTYKLENKIGHIF